MSKRIKITDLKPDPRNHNKHTASGMALLEKSVEQVGVIESITVSNDDQIISGNARHEVIGRKFDSEPIVIETDGTRPVILKRTDIQSNTPEFYKASILANTTAKKNIDIDIEVVEELAEEYDFAIEDVGVDVFKDEDDFEDEKNSTYSRKIESPVYVPVGDKPKSLDLVNSAMSELLISEIDSSDVSKEDKDFLKLAAFRHLVFDYSKIANYYAHSEKNVQELMEKSALVIIDFNKAIESGFVKLSKEIQDQFIEDYE